MAAQIFDRCRNHLVGTAGLVEFLPQAACHDFFLTGVQVAGIEIKVMMLGLMIAVPALFGGGYLQRRVETYAARIDVLLERLLAAKPASGS